MKVNGLHRRSIHAAADRRSVEVIDQRSLPHELVWLELRTVADVVHAIRQMCVRGAPLIGAVAAYGLCFALGEDTSEAGIDTARGILLATRPTAVNLRWALDEMRRALLAVPAALRWEAGWSRAASICDEDVAINQAIGEHGLSLFRTLHAEKGARQRLNILTHCNAGWIATVDWGTALAPIYMAHDAGLEVHVWVDETRPRNQGGLTAWELGQHGVPHTLVVDNAGGHLMQHGMVDVCIVGTDRVTARGDVCNKIGTYLKALAAKDNGVPFYVALPYPTIDWTMDDGVASIPIEERDADEVCSIDGVHASATSEPVRGRVRLFAPATKAANFAFDVTPARLVTGLVTERGIAPASRAGLLSLYPERGRTEHPSIAT
ncbi:MAG: S-methyl-5-thioribose-1-phosphate isomerase [Myxococcota bacterium]|nr:S-methyl-5-thioribose-1-phosphate isomerase [Myxococcota bacterium]